MSNNLTDAELERLAILAEECSEVIQIVNKIIRHGYDSYHPDNPNIHNIDLLEEELGHLGNIVRFMDAANDIKITLVDRYEQEKKKKFKNYLHEAENIDLTY